MSAKIIALYNTVYVEILDTFTMAGCELAAVKALAGKPFTGGDRWPISTPFATLRTAELAPVIQIGVHLREKQEA